MCVPAPAPTIDRPLTPGAYLKRRREAAYLSIADVAGRLSTEPRLAQFGRAEWLALIEADAAPATFSTIAALRSVYPFDLSVLGKLATIALGVPIDAPGLCRVCACSEWDCCRMAIGTCAWAASDLCSACADLVPAADAIGAAA